MYKRSKYYFRKYVYVKFIYCEKLLHASSFLFISVKLLSRTGFFFFFFNISLVTNSVNPNNLFSGHHVNLCAICFFRSHWISLNAVSNSSSSFDFLQHDEVNCDEINCGPAVKWWNEKDDLRDRDKNCNYANRPSLICRDSMKFVELAI